jgi:hypothetical protein
MKITVNTGVLKKDDFYITEITDEIFERIIEPATGEPYLDRDADFPYKIDENDLCYKLFIEKGFAAPAANPFIVFRFNTIKCFYHHRMFSAKNLINSLLSYSPLSR